MQLIVAIFIVVLCVSCSDALARGMPAMKSSIIDPSGREILPPTDRYIRYLGRGFFSLNECLVDSRDPGGIQLVTEDGVNIDVKAPKGSVVTDVFLPSKSEDTEKFVKGCLPSGTLFQVRSGNKFGISDLSGNVIVEPIYDYIGAPVHGLFAIRKEKVLQFALVPISRKIVTDARKLLLLDSDKVGYHPFCQNRKRYLDKSHDRSLYGFLDASGNVIVEPRFVMATEFARCGVARVWTDEADENDRSCYLVNTQGQRVGKRQFNAVYGFHDGLAAVRVKTASGEFRYGLIDSKSNYVLKPHWNKLSHLFERTYIAQKRAGERMVAITETGSVLFEFPERTLDAKESNGLIVCYRGDSEDPSWPIAKRKQLCLLSHSGQLIYANDNCEQLAVSNGMVVLADFRENQISSEKNCSIVSRSGRTAEGINAWFIQPVSKNRLIKKVVDKSFSSEIWRRDVYSRDMQLSNFLREHDLIGMSRDRVESFLGKPDFETCYRNHQGACGCTEGWIELRYENETVWGWRWAGSVYRKVTTTPWVKTNVTYDYIPFRLITQKSIGELTPKYAKAERAER